MSKAFSAVQSGDQKGVLLVDALNLSFRYKHKRQRNFAADYLRTIESIANSYGCGTIILCADKGSSSYRKEIYPEYKQNRKDKFKDQTEEEKQEFLEFLEDYEHALELASSSYPLLRFQGVEADDIISIIAQALRNKKVWIVSSDKDLDQLVTPTVSRFSYITRKEITAENFEDTYGCTPQEYISIKVLQGDAGDNVKGIEGIGPKRAASLIREYGSAMDIYDALPLSGKYKYIQALNESGDLILTNYQVMDLSFSREAVGEHYNAIMDLIKNELSLL